jgi:hypothetical protein
MSVRTTTGTAIRPSRSCPTRPTRTASTPAARSAFAYAVANRRCGVAVWARGVSSRHIAALSRCAQAVANRCAASCRASIASSRARQR